MRTILPYLVAGLLGYTIAHSFFLARQVRSPILTILAWLGILYLSFFGFAPLVDERLWQSRATFPILYICSILLGIGVRKTISSMNSRKADDSGSVRNALGISITFQVVWSISIPALIIFGDVGQFLFDLHDGAVGFFAAAISFGVVYGLICCALAVRVKSQWVVFLAGVIPLLILCNIWTNIPIFVAYGLGFKVGRELQNATRHQGFNAGAFVLMLFSAIVFNQFMNRYTVGGFGAYFPDLFAPALHSSLMFPFAFLTSYFLARLIRSKSLDSIPESTPLR